MADLSEATWHVKMAIDALNEGYRCLSARLNALLRARAPGVQIDCDPVRPRDSMERAQAAFRQALPGLRTLRPLPSRDYEIFPWTLGYVNDKCNSRIMLGASEPATDDVESALNFLASDSQARWKPEHWQRNIVDPIQQQHKKWLAFPEACQGQLEPVGKNRNHEAEDTEPRDATPKRAATVNERMAGTIMEHPEAMG